MPQVRKGPEPLLSIVIPVYNEGNSIFAVVREITEHHWGCRIEIIVVDDCSSDQTEARLRLIKDERLSVLKHQRRQGSGAARRTGITHSSGDYVAWMDGDGTYECADLSRMTDGLKSHDQVIGSRSVDYGNFRCLRWHVKGAINRVVGYLWGVRVSDVNSGLRVFHREAIMAIVNSLPDRFSCATTATLATLNRGGKICFVPISYRPRISGTHSKFHPLFDTARLIKVVANLYWARRRAKKTEAPERITR